MRGTFPLQHAKQYCTSFCTDGLLCCSLVKERTVVDGNVITSKGPGSSLEFSLRLVSALYSDEKADEVAAPMALSRGLDY